MHRGGSTSSEAGPATGLEAAAIVGSRIRADLRAIIEAFPLEYRSPTRAAPWLGISRPVCQRLISATRAGESSIEVLRRVPGLQGLVGFVDAIERRGIAKDLVASFSAAVQSYAALLDRAGGSRADLLRALHHAEQGSVTFPDEPGGATRLPVDDRQSIRRAAFEANTRLLGREYNAQVGAFLYAPSSTSPNGVDCVSALGLCGVQIRPGAMPVCPFGWFTIGDSSKDTRDDQLVGPGRQAIPGFPVSILTEFSSVPCPRVIPRRTGSRVTAIVEPTHEDGARFDLFLATRLISGAHPGRGNPPIQRAFLIDGGPSRALSIVVLLHRSLAQQSVQGTGVFIRHDAVMSSAPGAFIDSPEDRWQDRLPDAPPLECMGKNFLGSNYTVMPRMPALLTTLIEIGGHDPSEFVGFRIETAYPVWNAPYVLWMDFRPFEPDSPLSDDADEDA